MHITPELWTPQRKRPQSSHGIYILLGPRVVYQSLVASGGQDSVPEAESWVCRETACAKALGQQSLGTVWEVGQARPQCVGL